MSQEMHDLGVAHYNKIVKMEMLEFISGNNKFFNPAFELPAPPYHNSNVLKTEVKKVHELMVPVKDADTWNKKRTEARMHDSNLDIPKWNQISFFPFFKAINVERRARFKNWFH